MCAEQLSVTVTGTHKFLNQNFEMLGGAEVRQRARS